MRLSDRVRRAVVRCWRVRCYSLVRGTDLGWGRAACVDVATRGTVRDVRRLALLLLARVPGAYRVRAECGAELVTVGYTG